MPKKRKGKLEYTIVIKGECLATVLALLHTIDIYKFAQLNTIVVLHLSCLLQL